MNAIILSIGDELVLGQTVDTNSAWLSGQLASVGVGVLAHVTVGDDQKAIERAIEESSARCDILLISGGIGPTEDDLTRQALAAVMRAPLEENAIWMAELHKFFQARGRVMPPINRIQAMIPRGAEMIFNTAGTAAGIAVRLVGKGSGFGVQGSGSAEELRDQGSAQETAAPANSPLNPEPRTLNPLHACHVFVTPGVPKEMKVMFTRDILPHIQNAAGGAVILSRTLHTFGLGESAVAEKLSELMRRDRNPSVGTTVSAGVVSLRLNARFASRDEAQRQLDATEAACRAALGDLIYGQDEQTLQAVIADMLMTGKGLALPLSISPSLNPSPPDITVATAESCTGGLLAKMLTDTSGSSVYFTHGWVTYANQAKMDELGVSEELLRQHGAVSEPVAIAMAEGARKNARASFGIGITGIAGPTGGTPQKPVGTVCIALARPVGETSVRTFLFPGDREMIRDRSAKTALTMLRFQLLDKALPF